VTVADASLLNFEDDTSHTITVLASDGDGPTSSQTFTINVTDVDPSTPTDTDAAANTVAEGAANGTAVGITASATDPNGPPVTYSLSDDAGGRFAIDATTGVVTVADASLLNFEDDTSHTITVLASDGDGPTSSQTFTINVTDVNEAPTVTSGATASVAENAPASTVVYTATATDPDTTAPNNT
ncbi:cadherin repeat domain-containing protein, partial [Mesorhizobium neociceri]